MLTVNSNFKFSRHLQFKKYLRNIWEAKPNISIISFLIYIQNACSVYFHSDEKILFQVSSLKKKKVSYKNIN